MTAGDWSIVLEAMGVRPLTAARWTTPFADEVRYERFSKGRDDVAAWLPQVLHECAMLERMEENLHYSAERISDVWPSRFPTPNDARPYARSPEALANKVYGGRMGNTELGDGWRFRGRGLIMATGRATYESVGNLMGQDLTVLPELMEQPRYAIEAAVAWWEGNLPDAFLSDQTKVRRRVNGGLIGLDHCLSLHKIAKRVLP